MRKLVWNNELEAVAQRWSDQCNFGHDSVRDKLDGTSVGQNAYWGANSVQQSEAQVQEAANINKATQAWWVAELYSYRYTILTHSYLKGMTR